MKKLLFIALFSMAFISNAQEVSFGVKAGVNFASVNGDDIEDIDGRTGLHIGAVAKIGFSELLAIQPEVVYSAQGFTGDEDVTAKLDYINIPIMLDLTLAEGFSLQGGPQFGINVTGELDNGDETVDIDDVETMDIAVGIGAQYKLPMGLFFQARYVIGVNDIFDETDAKNSVISLSAGWFF